ncbi:hypothetical protein [Prauserella endophytica]|uniref:Uncharacterized protein n=1 Tax=Prauserella endophytica TaxID=1592324 RepID=A0ABY2RTV4_9PSEU|nr:hypothetical protein [Prauserella endophytica]TKG57847.1 hypothetical protein FCN18_38660 [Prauserella endophytica]
MPRRDRDQLDLFGEASAAPAPRPARQCPPTRGRSTRKPPANPLVAKDVLAEVQLGRFGLLDDTDRVMVFDDEGHVRAALDEDIVHHLLSGGYVERCPPRDTLTRLHGVVRKPVLPLRLTKTGRAMLQRWANLHPLGGS